jgi:hypothetical protein
LPDVRGFHDASADATWLCQAIEIPMDSDTFITNRLEADYYATRWM